MSGKLEFNFRNTMEDVAASGEFLRRFSEESGLSERQGYLLFLTYEELATNIVKYAGKNEPVVICCDVSCGAVRLTFVNGIGIPEGTVESTRIGLVNVKNMMERMGGTCRTEQSRERFSLTLLFPCI